MKSALAQELDEIWRAAPCLCPLGRSQWEATPNGLSVWGSFPNPDGDEDEEEAEEEAEDDENDGE